MLHIIKKLFKKREPVTWFSSDIHFCHNKVIEYCARPYANADEMDSAIIEYWNKTVHKDDTIFVIGDFSINPKNIPKILPRLNGKKILIIGNHDGLKPYVNDKKHEKNLKFHVGWAEIHDQLGLYLKNGQFVRLHHMPYQTAMNKEIDARYWDKRPYDNGSILLCGHQHCRYIKNGSQIDVGFDGELKFWSEDDIIALINDERDFIPSRLTEHYKTYKREGDY